MRAYTVHAPPGEAAPERFAFIKDGFSWPALFLPVLWMLWHRLWLTLMAYVIALLLLAWTERLSNNDIATALAVIGAILFAAEANNIRRWSLAHRGWRDLGSAQGGSLEEAETGFFNAWRKTPESGRSHVDTARREALASEDRTGHADHDGPIFGLFPEPER